MILKFSLSIFLLSQICEIFGQFNPDEDIKFIIMDKHHQNYEEASIISYSEVETLEKIFEFDFDNYAHITFVIHGYQEGRNLKHHKKLLE